MPLADLISNVQLVGKKICARPHQASRSGVLQAICLFKGGNAQGKYLIFVKMAIEQALLRRGQLNKGIQFQFRDGDFLLVVVCSGIDQQAVVFLNRCQ